ncbi:piggyBac transposable element-derived protein 4-like [Aplysia californica]|uniref:PiggyBac transposable element-derived protein 4-like n=1 Tax=Aplysia californica TaxID=6500 RepID=A0ABM1VTK0_APLCA|nr:piggyBac transposable element-derived protein 4-like [Aplysia californica]
MDNYYTSPALFHFLCNKNTFACGTVRSNRKGLPAAFADPRNAKLKDGETVVHLQDKLVAIKFQHKRTVNMLSTIHEPTGFAKYKPRRPLVMKPTCIHDYCSKMGGVDLMDQVTRYDEISRKSFKWCRKLAFYLIDLWMVNAYQLHRKFSPHRMCHSDFREAVITSLVAEAASVSQPASQRGASRAPSEARLTERHFSSYIPSKPGAKRKHGAKDCVVYNLPSSSREKFKRIQTSHWCEDCEVPLFYPDCFKLFHTVVDYKQEARRKEYMGLSRSSDLPL